MNCKKQLVILLCASLFLVFFADAFAVGPEYETSRPALMGRKLLRGLINIPFSIVEVPLAIHREIQNLDPFGGFWVGLAKGSWRTCKRLGSGVWDVVSFPFALPRGYRPLLSPEFPWICEE